MKCQLTVIRETLHQRIAVRFVIGTVTDGANIVHSTESPEATGTRGAASLRLGTQAAGVSVSSASRGALTAVAAHQVLTDSVGSTGR